MKKYKRPVLFSTVSLAAAITLFVGVLWPTAQPETYAAMITKTLARQSQKNPLLHVELSDLTVEEVTVDGIVEVGASGVAGSVAVTIREDEGPLKVDAAVAVTQDGGWILLRKLVLPDPTAQAIVNLLLPSGQETLLLLPKNSEIARDIGSDLQEGLRELQSGELIAVFKELITSHAEYGVTVEQQPDGTVRLILPIEDEEALEAIGQLFERFEEGKDPNAEQSRDRHDSAAQGKGRSAAKVHTRREAGPRHADLEHSDDFLIGATLSAVYDPATEAVRMLSITGLGQTKGSITVQLGDGDIDPALLDSSRVAKPGTRTIDLAAIESLIEGFGHAE
jgi:hypothetical protein